MNFNLFSKSVLDYKNLLAEEQMLLRKKSFLLSALKNRLKFTTDEAIHYTDELSSMNDSLVKKLLEYREVRNYTALDEKEDQLFFIEQLQTCEECKECVNEKIQDLQTIRNTHFSHGCKLEELFCVYQGLLNSFCELISAKTKQNIISKFRKYSSTVGKGIGEIGDVEYKMMRLTHKEVTHKLTTINKTMEKRIEKLDEISHTFEITKHRNNYYLSRRRGLLVKNINNKVKEIRTECSEIEQLKESIGRKNQEREHYQKHFTILTYEGFTEDHKNTIDQVAFLQNQLYQITNNYEKFKRERAHKFASH